MSAITSLTGSPLGSDPASRSAVALAAVAALAVTLAHTTHAQRTDEDTSYDGADRRPPRPAFVARLVDFPAGALSLEQSTNLVDWSQSAALVATNSEIVIIEPQSSMEAMRFYRVRPLSAAPAPGTLVQSPAPGPAPPAEPPIEIGRAPGAASSLWRLFATQFWDTSITTNRVLRFGYNADEGIPAEQILEMRFESDYFSAKGDRLMEWYLSHRSSEGVSIRPIMVQVSRNTQRIDANLRGNWAFVGSKTSQPVLIVRDEPSQAVAIGREPTTNLFDVFRVGGSTIHLGGPALGTPNDVSLDFYAANGSRNPTYARVGLSVWDGAAGRESGDIVFWTANAGALGERARLTRSGRLGLGTSNPQYTLDVVGAVRLQGQGSLLFSGPSPTSGVGLFWAGPKTLGLAGKLRLGVPDGASAASASGLEVEGDVRLPFGSSLRFGGAGAERDVGLRRAGGPIVELDGHLRLPNGNSLLFGAEAPNTHDTRLWRSDREELSVDARLAIRRYSKPDDALTVTLSSEAHPRFRLTGDAQLRFGSGTSDADVVVSRDRSGALAIGTLRAPSDLVVNGKTHLRAGGSATLTPAVSVLASVAGPVSAVGTNETTLSTQTVPPRTLERDGDSLSLRACGLTAGNSNYKEIRLYFGSSLLFATGMARLINCSWVVTCELVRISATSQVANVTFTSNSSVLRATSQVRLLNENLDISNSFRISGKGEASMDVTAFSTTTLWRPANP